MNIYQPFAVSTATNILPDMQYSESKIIRHKRKLNKKKAVNQSGAGCKRKKSAKKTGSGNIKTPVKSINTSKKSINTSKDEDEYNYIFRNSKYVKKNE